MAIKKDMQKEINKYQGYIFYYEMSTGKIYPATWIKTLDDYNHLEFDLHHVVPFTDWEKNTKNVRSIIQHNALILIAKVMHQHLENPIYKLNKVEFERLYGINPDVILYDINSRLPRTKNIFLNFVEQGHITPNKIYENHTPCSNSVEEKDNSSVYHTSTEFLLTDEDLTCFDEIYNKEIA